MLSSKLQSFLQNAVSAKLSPSITGVIFNRDGIVAQSAVGMRSPKEPASLDDIVWMASMSKAVTAFAALRVLEDLPEPYDIDSSDSLVEIIPELKHSQANPIWYLFNGQDEAGRLKLKPARQKLTLRHFLTHTSGLSYEFNSEEDKLASKYYGKFQETCKISSLLRPRHFEAGTQFLYGVNSEFVGLWMSRISGLSQREILHKYVLRPLNIPENTLDCWKSPEMQKNASPIYLKDLASNRFRRIRLDTIGFEDRPPEGYTEHSGGFLWGTLPSYAIFLRALLNRQLISPSLFDEAVSDALIKNKINIGASNSNILTSYNPRLASTVTHWNKEGSDLGWAMMGGIVLREESSSGLSKGTLQWCGMSNCFYFVDFEKGRGGVFSTMTLPYCHPEMIRFRQEFESFVTTNM